MENKQPGRGGYRGGVRPATGRTKMIGVRVSPEAAAMLDRVTTNKSKFIESLILAACAEK